MEALVPEALVSTVVATQVQSHPEHAATHAASVVWPAHLESLPQHGSVPALLGHAAIAPWCKGGGGEGGGESGSGGGGEGGSGAAQATAEVLQ